MPCGPGLYWDKQDKDGSDREFYVKKPLISGTSMGELRYLHYLMNFDSRFKDTNGARIKWNMHIEEHAYRGQVEIDGYKIDLMDIRLMDMLRLRTRYLSLSTMVVDIIRHTGCQFNKDYKSSEHETYEWYKKESALRNWCSENNSPSF